MTFTAADWVIVAIIALSSLLSVLRGFIKEAISLIAWVAAFAITGNFYRDLAARFTFFDDEITRVVLSILALFVGTLIVIGTIGNLLRMLISKAGLSGTDRLLGIGFGFIRGVLVVSALLALLKILFKIHILSFLEDEVFWQNSVLIPELMRIVNWFFIYLGTDVGAGN